MNGKTGKLFIVAGPSGVGKGTALKKFLAHNDNLIYSISTTTRKPREGEVEGVNYFYVAREKFEQMIEENAFLEWAEYSGNLYGTSKNYVTKKLNEGYDIILEIEVQGVKKIMKQNLDAVSIFIMPPSQEELEERLRGRNTESEEAVQKRLNAAKEEMKNAHLFKYQIKNITVEQAFNELQAVYESERNWEMF